MVENYKNYYKNKITELKTTINNLKEIAINSYLTYDTEYYINEYNIRSEEINKYLVELESKTIEHITTEQLSFISENINLQFPNYLLNPTLLGYFK
jgi:hypothetical protein